MTHVRMLALAAEYMGDIEFAQFKHAWEREFQAASDWQPIETAPKEVYILCAVLPPHSEAKLHEAIWGEEPTPYLRLVIARRKKGDPKHKVRQAVNGHIHVATHWQPLPDLPRGANDEHE